MNAISDRRSPRTQAPRSITRRRAAHDPRTTSRPVAAAGPAPQLQPAAFDRVPARRYLPQVLAATFLVAICPIVILWRLRSAGIVTSAPIGMAIAMLISLGASHVGTAFWETRTNSADVLFGELMLWGFIGRLRHERRLASALQLLGPMNEAQSRVAGGLSAQAQAQALEQLGTALEATDPHTSGHSRRVARHAWMIARQMGLKGEAVARIRTAAAVHDVGKVATPQSVLRKRGPLTDEEFAVIKRHPVDGAHMVETLGDAELTSIVRHHHERLDGTGYPDGLGRDAIPLGSRIIAVADTFDAITFARPYRPGRSHKAAIEILKAEAGTQLDTAVVRAFCGLYSGRRPLAIWASLTSLPAQVFSWIGGGVAGVAAVAQVAAVTAVAAVGTATILPVPSKPSHKRVLVAHRLAPVAEVAAVSAAPSQPSPAPGHARAHAHSPRAGTASPGALKHAPASAAPGTPASPATGLPGATLQAAATAAAGAGAAASGGGPAKSSVETAPVNSETARSRTEPAEKRAERPKPKRELATKSKLEQAAALKREEAKAKRKEADALAEAAKVKSEAASGLRAQAKAATAAAVTSDEEAKASEEAAKKLAAEAQAKSEEAKSKREAATVASPEAQKQREEAKTLSAEAQAKREEAHAQSEAAHAKREAASADRQAAAARSAEAKADYEEAKSKLAEAAAKRQEADTLLREAKA